MDKGLDLYNYTKFMTEKNDNINATKPLSKRIGKTGLFYSVIVFCVAFILSRIVPFDVISEFMIKIAAASMMSAGACLVLMFGNNRGCSNYRGPESMSILDARNPAGPNYWDRK
jgi:hypothetical protein